jgi:hypothetical protein
MESFSRLLEDQPWFESIGDDGGRVRLRLIEVCAMKSYPGQESTPFSIVLRGPSEPVIAQRIFALTHVSLGTLDLFLVPIGPDEQGMRYEAVFN